MADDELLRACEAAPKFGLNAKALILEAAALGDDEDGPLEPVRSAAEETREREKDFVTRASEFLGAVTPELRPMLQDRAFSWAKDQELELFRRCETAGAYQTHLLTLSALSWEPATRGRRELVPKAVEEAKGGAQPPKRRRPSLLNKDIDWTVAVPEAEAETAQEAKPSAANEAQQAAAPARQIPKAGSATLLTEDKDILDERLGKSAEPTPLDEAVRRQLAELEGSGWRLGDTVVCEIAARCAVKVLRGRDDACVESILRAEGPKIRKLVWQEAQLALAKSIRKTGDGGD
ncbi:hypothetical protein QBZ16_004568 [Prototheca wickerhamii]|uniref:Uncharacterized protein n=1 Tax=Prototheca wickerhamii TaxID=3111 RepID=A0AAD9IK89_PROWI|nr:hypothetical protein QBZ16_004568 [Prototheca wickerhamii]